MCSVGRQRGLTEIFCPRSEIVICAVGKQSSYSIHFKWVWNELCSLKSTWCTVNFQNFPPYNTYRKNIYSEMGENICNLQKRHAKSIMTSKHTLCKEKFKKLPQEFFFSDFLPYLTGPGGCSKWMCGVQLPAGLNHNTTVQLKYF